MSEEVLNAFFDEFETSYPGLKRAKNKPYALMALKSKAEIALAVKKKSVKVEISSPGGDDALSTDALKSWAEDNDILDTDIDGRCFELAAGARNKDKLSVVVEIPLESEDQVGDAMFQADVKAAMDLIWNNLSELVDAPDAAPESQDSGMVSDGAKIETLSVKKVEAELDEDNEFSGDVTLKTDQLGSPGDVVFAVGELIVCIEGADEERSEIRETAEIGKYDLSFSAGYIETSKTGTVSYEITAVLDIYRFRNSETVTFDAPPTSQDVVINLSSAGVCVEKLECMYRGDDLSAGVYVKGEPPFAYSVKMLPADVDPSISPEFSDEDSCDCGAYSPGVKPGDPLKVVLAVGELIAEKVRVETSGSLKGGSDGDESAESASPAGKLPANLEAAFDTLSDVLGCVIDDATDGILETQSFKVREDYGPGKFYLDRVDGSYESSLQNLIHHILVADGLYCIFLNDRQTQEAEAIAEDDPDSIYRPDPDSADTDEEAEEDEAAQEMLDLLYAEAIKYTAGVLEKFSFFDRDGFLEKAGF